MVRMMIFISLCSLSLGTAALGEDPVRSFDRAVSDLLKEPGKAGNKAGQKVTDAVDKTAQDVDKSVRKAVKSDNRKKGRDHEKSSGR